MLDCRAPGANNKIAVWLSGAAAQKVPRRGGMRHHGGRTAGVDVNGFANASGINEDTLEAITLSPSTTSDGQ